MSESHFELLPVPLIEAIIEVRFPGDARIEAIRGEYQQGIAAEFPLLFVPKLQLGDVPALLPYRFENEGRTRSVALSLHSLAYSTKQYPGWEVFLAEWSRLWSELTAKVGVKRLTRIGMRYVNRFDGTLRQKLSFGAPPPYLVVPLQDERATHRSTTEYVSDASSLLVNVEQAGADGTLKLDFDCYVQDMAAEDLKAQLELLHSRIEGEFLHAIEQAYSLEINVSTVKG